MFTRLYFDTNILVAGRWPRLSADLENVFKFTIGSVGVFLPAGVEAELEHRWQRELTEKTRTMKSAVRAVETHFAGIREVKIAVQAPGSGNSLEEYRRTVDEVKRKYALSTVPFTTRPVSEIFAM